MVKDCAKRHWIHERLRRTEKFREGFRQSTEREQTYTDRSEAVAERRK